MAKYALLWTVRFGDGDDIERAKCLYAEDAAALVAVLGEGATICFGPRDVVVWEEGSESQPASESYDHVGDTCRTRSRESEVR